MTTRSLNIAYLNGKSLWNLENANVKELKSEYWKYNKYFLGWNSDHNLIIMPETYGNLL